MDDVKVEETERQPHPEYELLNTEQYRKQVFSMCSGELHKVTLTFTKDLLSEVFDRFGDDIHIRAIDDNTYTADISVQVSKPLFTWVIGTLGKVRITAPKKVTAEFNKFVDTIKSTY